MTKEAIIEKLKPIVQPFVKNEEAFHIEIDNESMEKMLNVENTVAIIQKKLAAQ